ncbi:hypothetical protein D3C80_1486960 [compost metagenome]
MESLGDAGGLKEVMATRLGFRTQCGCQLTFVHLTSQCADPPVGSIRRYKVIPILTRDFFRGIEARVFDKVSHEN